jgi:hypothetical protein
MIMARKSCNHPVKFKAKRSWSPKCDSLKGAEKKECIALESHYNKKVVEFRTKCGRRDWSENQRAAQRIFRQRALKVNGSAKRKACAKFADKNRRAACYRNTWE